MKKSTLHRIDLVFSIILMIISIATIISSYQLFINPFGRSADKVTPESIQLEIDQWYTSPALVPFLLAIVLAICAISLFMTAIKDGARFDFFSISKLKFVLTQRETWIFFIIVAILSLYIFVLIPTCRQYLNFFPKFQGFPFMIATFICLAAQMLIFSEKTLKKLLTCVLVAAVSAFVITYGFGVLAMIPLP
ncbi:MAG: hypothetical protein ATN31_07905 [Candidatus Epulonipiscioides saccharophilum]|nr:MAG: hypothetical protein ATN31_07905 [Epulopiscium sp. AS2M-Bin001]